MGTTATDLSSHPEIASILADLDTTMRQMETHKALMGKARTVIEYDSDMRKMALSDAMREHLVAGESATSAEAKARGSEAYKAKLRTLFANMEHANGIITQWYVMTTKLDVLRSRLSLEKELVSRV